MNNICYFPDCKIPKNHHNTDQHRCGACGMLGHSRALHNNPKAISEVLCLDGRGKSTCRICSSASHLTGHHDCKKCGALGHTEAYCRITKRGADPWHRYVLESVGDYLPKAAWCEITNCSVPHLHITSDHACNDCGYRHDSNINNNLMHYTLTCAICRTMCRITEQGLTPDEDADDTECNICGDLSQQCRLQCGHAMCPNCLDQWLAEESRKTISQRYGDIATATTREQAVDVYKIAATRFNTFVNNNINNRDSDDIKMYTIIKNGSLTFLMSRAAKEGAINAVGYESMNSIETSAVHNRMRTDGFALIE